ncbi:hypothetical protein GGI42DRAFT_316220 [Trichoderma sp. SZMC 28013]
MAAHSGSPTRTHGLGQMRPYVIRCSALFDLGQDWRYMVSGGGAGIWEYGGYGVGAKWTSRSPDGVGWTKGSSKQVSCLSFSMAPRQLMDLSVRRGVEQTFGV